VPRVLYVNQTAATSGAEASLLTLFAALPPDVQPLLACPPGRLTTLAAAQGVRTVPIDGTDASFRLDLRDTPPQLLTLARSGFQVARAAHRQGSEVVHANTTRAGLIAIAARAWGAPAPIVHVRDWLPQSRAADLVLKIVARGASTVLANSQHIADQFDRIGLPDRAVVIHNPIDLARFDPALHDRAAARAALGIAADVPLAGVVGQLTPWKGQEDAIRALAACRVAVPDAELIVAGSAKFATAAARFDNAGYAAGLPALARELGIEDAVHFLGESDDVPGVLAALDVLLVPSWEEAFGRVVVEGMAMGLPVLATATGGPPELVRAGVNGELLAPQDPERWGAVLAELLSDPERRTHLSAAALVRAGGARRADRRAVRSAHRGLMAHGPGKAQPCAARAGSRTA